jgi:hypothetical protein
VRIAGFAVGGVGAAALVVFAVTGGLTLAKKADIQQNCTLNDKKGTAACNPAGLAAGNSAATLGTVSTATFIAGLVAVGAGVGLIVAGGRPASAPPAAPAARVAPAVLVAGPGGLVLGAEGAF